MCCTCTVSYVNIVRSRAGMPGFTSPVSPTGSVIHHAPSNASDKLHSVVESLNKGSVKGSDEEDAFADMPGMESGTDSDEGGPPSARKRRLKDIAKGLATKKLHPHAFYSRGAKSRVEEPSSPSEVPLRHVRHKDASNGSSRSALSASILSDVPLRHVINKDASKGSSISASDKSVCAASVKSQPLPSSGEQAVAPGFLLRLDKDKKRYSTSGEQSIAAASVSRLNKDRSEAQSISTDSFSVCAEQVRPAEDDGKGGACLVCPVLSKAELLQQEEVKGKWQKGNKRRRGKDAVVNEKQMMKNVMKGMQIRKRAKIHDSNIKNVSRQSGRVCSCFATKGVNHYDYISKDMAKHYLYFLHDPDAEITSYLRRARAHQLIRECHDATRQERFMKKGTHGGHNIKYFLHDPFREKKVPLCCAVFSDVIGVAVATVERIRKRVVLGLPPKDTFRAPVASPAYLAIHTNLEALAEDLANESPDLKTVELPMGRKNHYYLLFVEGWRAGVEAGIYQGDPDKPPSLDLFYKVWRRDFNALKVPKRSNRFSKCETCIERRQAIDNARELKDVAAILKTKQELLGHYKWVTLQRKVYHNDRAEAGFNQAR